MAMNMKLGKYIPQLLQVLWKFLLNNVSAAPNKHLVFCVSLNFLFSNFVIPALPVALGFFVGWCSLV